MKSYIGLENKGWKSGILFISAKPKRVEKLAGSLPIWLLLLQSIFIPCFLNAITASNLAKKSSRNLYVRVTFRGFNVMKSSRDPRQNTILIYSKENCIIIVFMNECLQQAKILSPRGWGGKPLPVETEPACAQHASAIQIPSPMRSRARRFVP